MTTTKILTLVVPIYNVELYLNQCLDSILNQRDDALEVILVDDGSTDKSGIIAKQYATNYPDLFKYVYKENAGLGAARNTGLELCNTDYIEFLDSDDWLIPKTISTIISRIKEEPNPIDIIFMTPIIYNAASHKYEEWYDNNRLNNIFSSCVVTNPEQCTDMYALEPSVNRCVWNMSLLKKISFRFPEGVKWEDVLPHFQIYQYAKRCIMVENVGFYYRINTGNQITAGTGIGRLDVPTVFTKTLIYAFENKWSEEQISYILKMMVNFSLWSIRMSSKTVLPILVKRLHELYAIIPNRYYIKLYQIHTLRMKEKLMIHILKSPFYRLIDNSNKIDFGTKLLRKIKN